MALSFEESKALLMQQAATPMVMSMARSVEPVAAYSGEIWTQDNNYRWFNDYFDDKISYIDENKNITVDPSQVNISQEVNSQFIPFEMMQKYDGIDLSKMAISIHYDRSDGTHGTSEPVNVEYSGEKIRFVWLVDEQATCVVGNFKFEIHADGAIVDSAGNSYGYRWKSKSTDKFNIVKSLCDTDCEEAIVVTDDWVTDIVTSVTEKVTDTIVDAQISTQVAAAETAAANAEVSAQEAASAAQTAVETILVDGNYATKDYVGEQIAAIPIPDASEQISVHNTATDAHSDIRALIDNITVPTKVSALENDVGYLTEHQSLEGLATETYVADKLGAIVDTAGNPLTVAQYVEEQINAVDVSDQLGDLGTNEDGSIKTVVQYVNEAIEAVDVSDQLGDLADEEGNDRTVQQYVDDSVAAIDVTEQLADYAKSADVYTKTEVDTQHSALSSSVDTNTTNIASLSGTVGELQTTVNGIDTSPRLTYDVSYNDTEDPDVGENVFVFYEIENEGLENEVKEAKKKFTIVGGSGGGATSSSLKIGFITTSPLVVTTSDEAIIKYTFSGTDSSGDIITEGAATWKVGTSSATARVVATNIALSGENTFDVTEYLSIGTQKVYLSITDEAGSLVTKSWTVQKIDVRLESTFNDKLTYPIGAVSFTYTPYGAISKDVHFILDGIEIGTVTTSSSGIPMAYEIPAQEHGAHLLEVYMTAEINGNAIESNHIVKDIIWYDETSTVPVIGTVYQSFTARQYDSTNIEYTVYDPTTETPTVEIAVDGEVVSTPTLSETTNIYSYKTDVVGDHTITITCGETVKTLTATITELDIDVAPITAGLVFDFNPSGKSNNDTDRVWTNGTVSMAVSDNFDWVNGGYQYDDNGDQYFCIKAGTSATIDYELFADDAKLNGKEFKLVFKTTNVARPDATFLSCMDNTTGSDHIGIQMDVQEAFIYGQAGSLHLPYSEEDIIEFEFNISKDTEAIPMVMGYEDGVSTRPMVYDSSYSFTQNTPQVISLGSDDCDLHIYRFKVYNVSLTELDEKAILNNFIADARNAEEMIARYERNQIYDENQNLDPDIFAEKCPWLRVYKLSAPYFTNNKSDKVPNTTIQQIYKNGDATLDNWTCYYAQHSGQGTSSNNYGAAGRNLDFIMNKSGIDGVKPYFILGDGTKATEITMTRTSVPVAYLNAKVNIASSNNMTNAMLANRYNEFNPYKRPFVRTASLSDVYSDDEISAMTEEEQTAALSALQEKVDAETSYIKDTMEFHNCVIFIQETNTDMSTHREFADNDWHLYAIGNIGDSKKTDETRLTDQDDPYECCVEIMDVKLPLSDFPVDTMMDAMGTYEDETTKETVYIWAKDENLGILYELIDGEYVLTEDTTVDFNKTYYVDILEHDDFSEDYTYGWRYISDEDDADIVDYCHQRWIEFYRFVTTSTNEEFKAGIGDYFVLDSALYYYLFTTRYTMVDNRAKNSFWHYGWCGEYDDDGNKIRKWDLSWDYDNDTALGLNNYGKQVYRYGLEDTDVDEKGEEVFREMDSTFFCRIRDLFPNELKAMYQTLESKNAWHAESFINQADAWQSEFPEELWRLDIKRKYLRTYTESFINGKADSQFLVNMANGKMKYHRRQWERSQEKYMASKYQSSVASSDNSVLRCATPTGDLVVAPNYRLKLVPYAYMYINAKYGTQSPIQIKAEPNKEYEIPYEGSFADIIDVWSSSLLRSFGDLSSCYAATVDTSKASKIKELIIGNETEGYDNPYLTTLTTGANYLLEKLNVENVSGLTQALDLSALNNLQELYAHGSNIGGVIFADGGKIEIAELPAINAMTMKNLLYLTTLDVVDWSKLTSMTVENCDTVDLITILDSTTSVNRIRIVGIDWELANGSADDDEDKEVPLLNRLYALKGFDKNGYNADQSVLTGKVHVPIIRQQKLHEYQAAWPDLEITYNTLITQYAVTFINTDENGTILDVQYVDEGEKPVDPTTRADNPISTPTMESTVSTNYTFAGWDSDFVAAFENATIKATYTETTRKYTVKYVNSNGDVLQETTALYGAAVLYEGDIPTYTDEESAYRYYLFDGWDQFGYVDGDKTITAVYDSCKYSAGYFADKELSSMRPVEIYAMTKLADAGIGFDISSYVESKDSISIALGQDVSYSNVEERVLVDSEIVFTGSNYLDTQVQLLSEDRDFVLAIDYSISSATPSGSMFAECYSDNGMSGFRLWNNSGIKLGWGTSSMTPSSAGSREIIVLRHIKGENGIHVYASNSSGSEQTYIELSGAHSMCHDGTLVFGCSKADDGSYENYAVGSVYWSKVWYADLGNETCLELTCWPHEEINFEMCGFKRYYLSENTSKRTTMSFLASGVLSNATKLSGSTTGGWAEATLNGYLNSRVYAAFPMKWRQLIKKAQVKSSVGGKSSDVTSSDCYIAIPSVYELDYTMSSEPYSTEIYPAQTIDYFVPTSTETASSLRICYDKDGNAVAYWTRSPNADYTSYQYIVNTSGDMYGYRYPYESYYVRIMFSV